VALLWALGTCLWDLVFYLHTTWCSAHLEEWIWPIQELLGTWPPLCCL
jgi:hypothetical protein